MAQFIQARDISLEKLQTQFNFNLQLVPTEDFFGELKTNFSAPTDFERQRLERVRQNYLNLSNRRSFSEEAVRMVVSSPLATSRFSQFFQTPFGIQTEESIEITAVDEGVIVSQNARSDSPKINCI